MYPTYLSMNFDHTPGRIDLKERVPKQGDDTAFPFPITLLETDTKVSLSIRIDEVGDRMISIDVHHVENEETKRVFHVTLDALLTWEMVGQLRNFFELFVKFEDDDEC